MLLAPRDVILSGVGLVRREEAFSETDIDPAWSDPGRDRRLMALDRMAETRPSSGRHHRRASEFHLLFPYHHRNPYQCGPFTAFVAPEPVIT